MDDERWAFEEELEQDDDPSRSSSTEPVLEEDRISGQDQDGVVTEWSGKAAETYKATVPAQVAGLNSLQDLGLQIRNSLVNLANGLESFWLQIYGTVAGLVIATAAAVVSAISVVGIPAAIVILIGVLGAGIASIFTTISAVDSLTNSIGVEQTAILDKVTSLGSAWPKTNTESMSHPTDWKRQS